MLTTCLKPDYDYDMRTLKNFNIYKSYFRKFAEKSQNVANILRQLFFREQNSYVSYILKIRMSFEKIYKRLATGELFFNFKIILCYTMKSANNHSFEVQEWDYCQRWFVV